eukprot:symbB.v1.2.018198.t1/scaffold1442.1/size120416/8
MSPLALKSYTSSLEGKLSSTSDERKAIQSAVESYYALPGVPDSELESVDLQDFFNNNGVLIADRPQNWVLLASLGRPLSRSKPSTEQHGSLSTRQQLLNSQNSLENARKRAQFQRKETSEFQGTTNSRAVDIQRLRHLHLVFQPLEYVPSAPIFKKHIVQVYMEDASGLNREEEDLEEQTLMNKGTGSTMNNDQRSLLHTIFKKSILKVTGKGGRTALMYRWTWFRFLIHCKLIGPDGSWDMTTPAETKVPWSLAVKIFKLFQEPSSQPPALSFSGWANALQATIRARGLYTTGPEVIEAVFSTFIPRAQAQLGISEDEARRSQGDGRHSVSSQRSASRSQSRSMSRANSRSMSRSLSRSQSRNMSRSMSRSMSKVGRSSSRALSFFSAGGSTVGEDSDDTMTDDGKLPLVWQINLAEQQLCEPECLQLIHEYIGLLKILFKHYAEDGKISQDLFITLLKELRFFPDFVQHYSLKKHLNATEARYGEEELGFPAFVETLCRICFCFLNIYGNSAQQSAASKYKMLWVLALLEARLPRKFRRRSGDEGDDQEVGDHLQPQGPDSLWHQRDVDFDISVCESKDIILWQTMDKTANALPIIQGNNGAAGSTLESEIDKALSMLRR